MKLSNDNIRETVDQAKSLLAQEKKLSPQGMLDQLDLIERFEAPGYQAYFGEIVSVLLARYEYAEI